MIRIGLAAAAAALSLTGTAAAEPPTTRTVDPKCPPGGCTIPVPNPVKARTLPGNTPTPPAATDHEIKQSTGDEPGTSSGRPHKMVGPPPIVHRVNPNPTPPKNPNGQKPPN